MRQYMPMLRRIVRMRENGRRAYLKDCDKRIIKCFSKCARNILKNSVPLKPLILPAITALGSILAGQVFGSGTRN